MIEICDKQFYEKHGRLCRCTLPKHADEYSHTGELI